VLQSMSDWFFQGEDGPKAAVFQFIVPNYSEHMDIPFKVFFSPIKVLLKPPSKSI